jgi:molybdopterin-guanine dinucleotide biosynthesis protein A
VSGRVGYDGGVSDVSAFVLAGGKSLRMGRDKALLPVGTESFLTLALANVGAVNSAPVIVGDRSRYSTYGPVVEDQYAGCGPLGGIHAALASSGSEWNLVLSVDLPMMKPEFLEYLVGVAGVCEEMAVVPKVEFQVQPLCALYRRHMLPVVEQALQQGRYKVEPVLLEAGARFVTDDEIASAGFSGAEMFRNVNTPEDYEWVKQHWAATAARH